MYSLFITSMTVYWTFVAVTAAPNGGACYDSDGIQNNDSFPCDSEAETTFCCAAGYICLSNGLCQPASNLSAYITPYFTSDCTDYSWNSPSACPEICNNNKTRQVELCSTIVCLIVERILTCRTVLVCHVRRTPCCEKHKLIVNRPSPRRWCLDLWR